MVLNERQQKKLRLAVIASVTTMFVLIVVLAFQIAIRTNHANQEKALVAELDSIRHQKNLADRDISHFYTQRFIEEYAWKNLGWARPGSSIFERP